MVTKATNSVLNLVDPPIDAIVLVNPLAVTSGGTGRNSLLAKAFLIGTGTTQIGQVLVDTGAIVIGDADDGIGQVAPATIGHALISNGPGVAPSFQQITLDIIAGILPVAQGGTGDASFGIGNLLVGNGTSPIAQVATGSSNLGYPLISQGDNTAPNYANMNANKLIGTLGVPTGGTGQSVLAANSVLIGNGTGAILQAPPVTAGQPLISNGSGSPPGFAPLDLGNTAAVSGLLQLTQVPVSIAAIFPTPGTYTFTPNSYQHYLYGECTGGGGGGAGENTGGPYTGGGGGAGGYACGWFPVTPGVAITITVGASGTFGVLTGDGSGNGGNGGGSSIGPFMSADGGQGGQSGSNCAGGAGGAASTYVPYNGMQTYGGWGGDGDLSTDDNFAGNGGASYWGGGIRGARGGPVATNGAFGSGGGGGYLGAGSIGMPGIVIIRG